MECIHREHEFGGTPSNAGFRIRTIDGVAEKEGDGKTGGGLVMDRYGKDARLRRNGTPGLDVHQTMVNMDGSENPGESGPVCSARQELLEGQGRKNTGKAL